MARAKSTAPHSSRSLHSQLHQAPANGQASVARRDFRMIAYVKEQSNSHYVSLYPSKRSLLIITASQRERNSKAFCSGCLKADRSYELAAKHVIGQLFKRAHKTDTTDTADITKALSRLTYTYFCMMFVCKNPYDAGAFQRNLCFFLSNHFRAILAGKYPQK